LEPAIAQKEGFFTFVFEERQKGAQSMCDRLKDRWIDGVDDGRWTTTCELMMRVSSWWNAHRLICATMEVRYAHPGKDPFHRIISETWDGFFKNTENR
jgi:hypothetical protein